MSMQSPHGERTHTSTTTADPAQYPTPQADIVRDTEHFLAVEDRDSGTRFTFERPDTADPSRVVLLDKSGLRNNSPANIVLPESVALRLHERGYRLAGTGLIKDVDSPVLTLSDLTAP